MKSMKLRRCSEVDMKTEVMFSSKSDEWSTPDYLFKDLDNEFHFTLDPCASEENHKCDKYYTKEDNGLIQSWAGERVFCNPPYGRQVKEWVRKAATSDAEIVVLLIFARTDTQYFHDYIYHKAELRFIKGRVKFGNAINNAPFPSMLVIFRKNKMIEGE